MKTEQEIKERILELKKIDIERRNEIRSLQRQQIEIQQEKLRALIGHCYKTNNRIFIITGVPKPEFTMTGDSYFNPYQLPAFIISTGENIKHNGKTANFGEMYRDMIYSGAVIGDPVLIMKREYTEISVEEFKTVASTVLNDIIEKYTKQEET